MEDVAVSEKEGEGPNPPEIEAPNDLDRVMVLSWYFLLAHAAELSLASESVSESQAASNSSDRGEKNVNSVPETAIDFIRMDGEKAGVTNSKKGRELW